MKKDARYKVIIGVLLGVVILQWIFIMRITQQRAPAVSVKARGRIAIVIDDLGYNLNNLEVLNRIKYPLTCSILPNLPYTQRIAEELNSRGHQIILHLPMEPREKYRLEKNTILTSMDAETIKNILDEDLAGISYAKGVSNHMGSRDTEDLRTMEIIFKELKKRHLYFLDSFVSSKSVCPYLARRMGMDFAKRDVFLDNSLEPAYIKSQLYKLKTKASALGQAIGIGHDRKVTLETLSEVMPQLEKEGYRFVFVSDLIS